MSLAWMILDAQIGKDIGKASRNISFHGTEWSRTNDQTISL